MQKEKTCKFCKKVYYYDDGVDTGGLLQEPTLQKPKIWAQCPNCVDPNAVPHETYSKGSIYTVYRNWLLSKDIVVPPDEVWNMLKSEHPKAHALFSTTTYRTITLYTGNKFPGRFGEFELGVVIPRTNGKQVLYDRQVKCCRCGKTSQVPKMRALAYFLGYIDKMCANCDRKVLFTSKDGKFVGGRKRTETSARAMAKELNISVMDFRRGNIPDEPVPSLPLGTIVNGLEIVRAYWDDDVNVYAPKYTLRCNRCKLTFEVIQKSVERLDHRCSIATHALGSNSKAT